MLSGSCERNQGPRRRDRGTWCHSCDVIALEAHVLLNPGKRLPVGIVRGVMCVEKCIVLRQPDSVCRMTVFVVCERSNVASMSVVVPV